MKPDFDKRIKEMPYSASWYNSTCGFNDSLTEYGVIDYDGLSDEDKLRLCVYAWNKADFCPRKTTIMKALGWDEKKFNSVRKAVEDVITEPTFSERTGLISGRGYSFYPKNN